MYDLDKQKFGAFVAQLRKEKGYTQKELADLLFISNKAISKWETGVSIPDTALLIPLAEALDITVTELLHCQRLSQDVSMAPDETEELVKTVIGLTEGEQKKYRPDRLKRGVQLLLCAAAGLLEVAFLLWQGYAPADLNLSLTTMMLLMFFFGLYFCSFARETLPKYYDDNRISTFSDGFFRMNVPGVYFNNRNWPYILRAGQLWAMIGLPASPALFFLVRTFFPALWHTAWTVLILLIALGGLFLPIVILGRKYEFAPGTAVPNATRDWTWICICLAIILILVCIFSAAGLVSSGSGSWANWSEGKTLGSWDISFSYFQGYRQRVVNVRGDETDLHIQADIEEGSLGLLVTDLNDHILYEETLPASARITVPLSGKIRLRITGEGAKGRISMAW